MALKVSPQGQVSIEVLSHQGPQGHVSIEVLSPQGQVSIEILSPQASGLSLSLNTSSQSSSRDITSPSGFLSARRSLACHTPKGG